MKRKPPSNRTTSTSSAKIVGKLEDAARKPGSAAQQGGRARAPNSPNGANSVKRASNEFRSTLRSEGKEGPDDVVDADFTDKKK
jgi:hypothetical protein